MIADVTQVALGGIVALMILREVFAHLQKRKGNGPSQPASIVQTARPATDRVKKVANGVDSVLSRLDRILERLEDISDEVRTARKQAQMNGELCSRLARQLETCEHTLTEIDDSTRRRKTGQNPIT